eukprot:TRINITY_DN14074_c0_g1_i1.p1 TRINITY_DN14074_c0_g1~~TRINITY_DN14074_c0_g1_i1.p1  ORF type:complete len:334 (-),score=48.73 TRINITY_DN14074_c0_g1_i1:19-1020(-)
MASFTSLPLDLIEEIASRCSVISRQKLRAVCQQCLQACPDAFPRLYVFCQCGVDASEQLQSPVLSFDGTEWRFCPELGLWNRAPRSSVVRRGTQLMIVGGCDPQTNLPCKGMFACDLDVPKRPSWTYVSNMAVCCPGQTQAHACCVDNVLYFTGHQFQSVDLDSGKVTLRVSSCADTAPAFGNRSIYQLQRFGTFTVFSHDRQRVEQGSALPMDTIAKSKMHHYAALAFHRNRLYFIGGAADEVFSKYDINTVTARVVSYDLNANEWTMHAPMPTARAKVVAAVYRDRVYAIGGRTGIGPVTVVESYDPQSDTWSTEPNCPVAIQNGANVFVW